MSSTVNVGALEASLKIGDHYTAIFDKFKADATAISERLTKLENGFSKTDKEVKKSKETVEKIDQSYRKVAASLDPVVANTQKFEKAEIALNAALKAGIITQDQHNKTLGQAKEKYLSANAHTLTWREEIHKLSGRVSNLSGLLGPFGSQIDNILGNLTAIAGSTATASKEMVTFGAVTASVTGIVTKAATAVKAFVASISGPVIAAFGSIVVAAGLVYGGFVLIGKGVNFVNEAVQTGLKTQLVVEKLNYALAANGSASGISARQMVEYAESLELATARSKEEIIAAETILSRFDSLGKEAFPKALDATLAYAKAMGVTANEAATKLGPALDGSTRSLNALKDAGLVLTAGQRKTLTEMVETGKVAEYQALLFDILKEKVGEAGDAYSNNLTRQAERAKIVLEDFGEGIATEVIPALEDVVSSLIEAAGGWEKLKFIVASAGREIGDIIRKTIYGVLINYHEWQSGTDQLAATILGGLSRIVEGFADFAPFAAFVPGMQGLARLSDEARSASERLGNAALKAGMSAAQHEKSVVSLSQKLVQHRTALEGDAEVYDKLGSSIDDVTAATKRQKDAMDNVNQSIEDMQRKVVNLRNAYLAALIGTKAYNAEILRQKVAEAILKEENKLREAGLKLQEGHRNAIAKAVIEEDLFNRKLKETLALNEKLLSVMLTATDNIAGKGFAADFKRFTDEAHRGMELIQDDVDSMLKGLEKIKDLDLDLEFNTRLLNVEPHLRDLEADYLSFLENLGSGFEQAGEDAIEAGERILTTIGTRFGKTADEVKAKLQQISDINLASDFKAQLAIPKTPTQELEALKRTLDRLKLSVDSTGKALLSESEAREIYNQALIEGAKEFATSVISVIQTLGTLGGATGKWNKALSGLSGIISSGGYDIGAWLQLFVGIAEGGTNKGGVHAGAKIDVAAGSAAVSEAWTMVKGQLKEMRAAAKEFGNAVNLIVRELGGALIDLPEIEILQKGEGWVVNIENMARRYFEDFQDAVAFGASEAVKQADLSGVSEEIMKAFRGIVFESLEQIRDFTSFANEYTSYGLSSLSVGLKDLTAWFVESARKANEYGLSIAKVGEEFGRRSQAWRDQVLGIVKSPQEQIAQNVVDFNNWVTQQRMSAQLQIDAAAAQMAAAKVQMAAAWADLKASGNDKDPEMMALFLEAQRLFKDAGARLDMWTKALANLPPLITPEEEEAAKKRNRGGGGRGSNRDSVKDWIDDKRFELDTRGLDEWAKRAADISRQYDQQMEQAGKDKKLRAELLALKERELQLLAQEQMLAVQASYEDFTGDVNAFQQVRDTARDLITSIENSPFGDAEKAAMIGNVMAEVAEQVNQLSLEMASSLFSGLIGDLERFGYTEEQLAGMRRNLAFIEHTLKVANYRAQFAILQAEGNLANEVLAMLGKAIEDFAAIDPTMIVPDIGEGTKSGQLYNKRREEMNQSVNNTVSDLEKLREAFRAAKDDINETVRKFDRGGFGAVDPVKSWEAALSQWNEVVSKAKGGDLEALKSASNVFGDTLDVLEKFSPALFASMAPILRDELADLGKLDTIKQGNLVITDFEKRQQHNETIDTLKSGFTDLSAHASTQQEQLGQLIGEVSGNSKRQQEINIRLMRLESANLARK